MQSVTHPVRLCSLPPRDLLGKLDLSGPDLAAAQAAAARQDRTGALAALLAHYRHRFPRTSRETAAATIATADAVVDRTFQWGPYEAARYGAEMDWEWDPRGDIEWVAAMYRFYWAQPLVDAFAATGDERYAAAFVELTRDWIAKHPLERHERTHPVYTGWRGFAWLDIQTGIRATNLCAAFRTLVHAAAFTPDFLGVLLASLYDHQVKTELLPMNQVHNKAVFEQRGFINVAWTFREFRDTRRWAELAMARVNESLLAQTTPDGVQREWSFGYHAGVLRDAVEIISRMGDLAIPVPPEFRDRVRRMHDYILWIAAPDLGAPMFGDASRPPTHGPDRSTWQLYPTLVQASADLGDPVYAARATLEAAHLPAPAGGVFRDAGIYALRSGWDADAIHLGLHCSPKAISGHDHPDNGTFELYAFGRWLMPDTGFYTYGHNPEARRWHRQTAVHQTMTLDGRDSADAGRHLLWHADAAGDALVVENASYPGLVHRRSVWFVQRQFFVFLDEAIGEAAGVLDLHVQFAPGDAVIDPANRWVRTAFADANVLLWTPPDAAAELAPEEGWYGWAYGHRAPRPAFRLRHPSAAPAFFLTVLVPYAGTTAPVVDGVWPSHLVVGADRLELEIAVDGRRRVVGRDLATGSAWCR